MPSYETLTAPCATDVLIDTVSVAGELYFGFAMNVQPCVGLPVSEVVTHVLPQESIPTQAIAILLEALREEVQGGGIFGLPLRDIQIVVTAVEYREGTSTAAAICTAACKAFGEFLQSANLVPGEQ